MNKTPAQKCIIVSDSTAYFFVFIDQDQDQKPSARLPFKNEIPPKTLDSSDLTVISEDLVLLNTHTEIDPFEIFPDFTTAYDYGFVSFDSKSEGFSSFRPDKPEDKKEYKYWDLLNDVDKQLVEEYLSRQIES